ncbi:helix-turn-helix transcriptional regulator [Comamonas antarctica]|uniref:helix-turn-helix domain-containing protein n=1 Tax=Comamonas antarctica TaxID=2743470 RepID=UPI0028E8E58C|nr:helix-turn-helix transcriptional regulator [Comamonas antarctica]
MTPEQKKDAARLKQLFVSWKEARRAGGEPASQDAFSDLVGFGQSAVSQYLNGKIPLNPQAAAKFSKALGCQISDFSETVASLAAEIGEAVVLSSGDQQVARMNITELTKQEVQIVLTLRELSPSAREELVLFASHLHQRGGGASFVGTLASHPAVNSKTKRTKTEKAEH